MMQDGGAVAASIGRAPATRGHDFHPGVLVNPESGRNRRHPRALAALRASHPALPWREAHDPASIAVALAELAGAGVDAVVIAGGDGTVQAALSVLFGNASPFARVPRLAVAAAGTTNMIAGDVGLRGRPARALERLLTTGTDGCALRHRHILRVDAGGGQAPVCGMYFGAAAIVSGIEYCTRRVHRLGLRGQLGPGLTLARFALAMARGQGALVPPLPLEVAIDGAPFTPVDAWIVQATTLERLFLGLRPFWGSGPQPLRYTQVRARPARWLGALPGLLRGRPGRRLTPARGYSSCNASRIQLRLRGRVVVDGELYAATPEQPVTVSDAGVAAFLQWR